MNQDFALLATPALARRLLLLQSICKLELPDNLTALAQCNQITEADFDDFVCPYTSEIATITQFLLDNDMRGIVQAPYHPVMNEAAMLNVMRLSKIDKLSILTRRASVWHKAANSHFLSDKIHIRPPFGLTGAWIDQRRDGVLLIDLCDQIKDHQCNRFIREFPRTILYQPLTMKLNQLTHWTQLAAMLFPTMPHPWTIRLLKNNPEHWATMKLKDFAPLYNMCLFIQYIKTEKLLATLEDNINTLMLNIY